MTVIWQPVLERGGRALARRRGARHAGAFCAAGRRTRPGTALPLGERAPPGRERARGPLHPETVRGRRREPERHRGCGRGDWLRLRLDGGDPLRLSARRVSDPAGRDERIRSSVYLGEMTKGVRRVSRCPSATRARMRPRSRPPHARRRRLADAGEKYWIGNGGASRYYVVFAKTDPGAGGRGISALMVDKEQAGAVVDELADKMGIRGTQTSNLKLESWCRTGADRRGQPRLAAGVSDPQCRARYCGRPIAGDGARRLSRGLAARRRTAWRSASPSSRTRASASSSRTWLSRSPPPA